MVHAGGGGTDSPLIERWTVERDAVDLRLGEELAVAVRVPEASVTGWVSEALLGADPGLVTRLLFEVPVATLLQRRSYAVVHAACVAGPAGAVVLRGRSGSGKSTLAAAAHGAGLDVLGDESILVCRTDPDALLAAVRDPTLEPDTTHRLALRGLPAATERTGAGKRRLDVSASSHPAARSRRRVATVLLGPRGGPSARLDPVEPGEFLREFPEGAIREEGWSEPAPHIARSWATAGAYRLTGAADLAGAVSLLARLAGFPFPVASVA